MNVILAKKMCDTIMKLKPNLSGKWNYDDGVVLLGFYSVYRNTLEKKYLDFIVDYIDRFIDDTDSLIGYEITEYNLDHLNNGKLLFILYNEINDKYLPAIKTLWRQIKTQPRTGEGGFWHKKIYPYQMWLDGLYMCQPFYAQIAKQFSQFEIYDDILKQYELIFKYTYDEDTGLMYHAYDEKKEQPWADRETGKSPNFWGRALGWLVVSLVDTLDFFPENRKQPLIDMLNKAIEGVIKYQDPHRKLWYQLIAKRELENNYIETSCSSMFIYAMLKGERKGYLAREYRKIGLDAFDSLVENYVTYDDDGNMYLENICSVAGLGPGNNNRNGSDEYYLSEPISNNDNKGLGAFLLACSEV